MNMKKRLLILSLSLCLGLGGSLTAYAAEVNPPAAENTENTETADQTETATCRKNRCSASGSSCAEGGSTGSGKHGKYTGS